MQDVFTGVNCVDIHGNPAGGYIKGTGLEIEWQDGPLGRGDERKEPNGAFVETVLAAAMSRLQFYQSGKFASTYNETAIAYIEQALITLNNRTKDRESRVVEGTHTV